MMLMLRDAMLRECGGDDAVVIMRERLSPA